MRLAAVVVVVSALFLIALVWVTTRVPAREGRRRRREEAEQRRRERELTGEEVPFAAWAYRRRPPGWYTDPWAPDAPHGDCYQRLWDGWDFGWTQCTRVLPCWREHPELHEGWLVWWDGERYDFNQCRPPTTDECRHPISHRFRGNDQRFSCDLCGLLGPCPHLRKRTWSGPTIGDSWHCYDCGTTHHAQTIPAPGTPGNSG